jgi:hypothetical protein
MLSDEIIRDNETRDLRGHVSTCGFFWRIWCATIGRVKTREEVRL